MPSNINPPYCAICAKHYSSADDYALIHEHGSVVAGVCKDCVRQSEIFKELEAERNRFKRLLGARANWTDEEFNAAWKEYLAIHREVRESDNDARKFDLISQAMQMGRKYGLPTSAETERDELRARVAELEAENEMLFGRAERAEAELDKWMEFCADFENKLDSTEEARVGALTRAEAAEAERDEARAERDRLATLDRTLTLPNGTVVKRGDVLAVASLAIKVTGIGDGDFLFKFLAIGPYWKGINGREAAASNYSGFDWRPWSEVYPDRPMPGAALAAAPEPQNLDDMIGALPDLPQVGKELEPEHGIDATEDEMDGER